MRILITGAKGQLGFDCEKELLERGYNDVFAIDKDDVDITDKNAIISFILKVKPHVIIHCAAFTAVDKAEENRDLAFLVNAKATEYIVEACKHINAKLIYISTDYVFPGRGTNFYEITDTPEPINFYGMSKLAGEKFALLYPKSFVVRTSWVYGINGNNFVKTMIKLGSLNDTLQIVSDQIGSPTYSADLAHFVCDLLESNKFGIYHATNEGVCSWAEFAKEIFLLTKMNVAVKPITTREYLIKKPNQAKRPLNSRLSKKSLDIAGFNHLPSWNDALYRFLKELKAI